jgi:hypothetical protein
MSTGVVVDDNANGNEEAPSGAPQFSEAELASIAKGREGISEAPPVNAPSAPAVPEGIPAKFVKDGVVDYAALAASYAELERKQSTAAPAAPAEGTPPAAAPNAAGKIEKPVVEEPAANPLTDLLTAARTDYESGQAFSEETAAKLVEAGIPAEIQQVYLEGLKALATQTLGALHGYVGGEQNYAAMAAWAGEKLNDAELDAFNAALDNPQLRENAVRGLYARFTQARPSEGRQITPVNAGASAGDVFNSRDELVAAQKDARYATDPVYRQSVVDKLQRSQAAGFRVTPARMFDAVYRHN